MGNNLDTLLVRAGEGREVTPFTTEKITLSQTGGDFGIREVSLPAGQSLPATTDTVNNIAATVLSGTVAFQVGDGEELIAGELATVILPRGVPHSARAVGDRSARYMALYGAAVAERKQPLERLLVPPFLQEGTGTHLAFTVRADMVEGAFSMQQGHIKPRELLPPHEHEYEDQCFYIVDGEMKVQVGGEAGVTFLAKRGDYILKPRHIVHTFWNETSTPNPYIEMSGGANFEHFVDSAQKGALRAALCAKRDYQVTFHTSMIPGLMMKNGLRSLASVEWPWNKR